jgi:hypothetical protein
MNSCGSFWWREVFKLTPIFRAITNVKIGDGGSTLFWKDNWENKKFVDIYPRAFSFVKNEDVPVQDFLAANRLPGSFHLPLSPQALEETRSLQASVAHVIMEICTNDKWTYD